MIPAAEDPLCPHDSVGWVWNVSSNLIMVKQFNTRIPFEFLIRFRVKFHKRLLKYTLKIKHLLRT